MASSLVFVYCTNNLYQGPQEANFYFKKTQRTLRSPVSNISMIFSLVASYSPPWLRWNYFKNFQFLTQPRKEKALNIIYFKSQKNKPFKPRISKLLAVTAKALLGLSIKMV
jgi:hypothetical protein